MSLLSRYKYFSMIEHIQFTLCHRLAGYLLKTLNFALSFELDKIDDIIFDIDYH